jgi:hypothetical protein
VYGRLRRDVVNVTIRTTYAVHRDMTLQVFLQPFVAVGDYTDIKRLVRPRSFEFERAEIPYNPDFNIKSLRSNVVLSGNTCEGARCFSSGMSRPAMPRARACSSRGATWGTRSRPMARMPSW